jgi:hypothetical protein
MNNFEEKYTKTRSVFSIIEPRGTRIIGTIYFKSRALLWELKLLAMMKSQLV